jgi:hypothetical protein
LNEGHQRWAVCSRPALGPAFGRGPDIAISDGCNVDREAL